MFRNLDNMASGMLNHAEVSWVVFNSVHSFREPVNAISAAAVMSMCDQ